MISDKVEFEQWLVGQQADVGTYRRMMGLFQRVDPARRILVLMQTRDGATLRETEEYIFSLLVRKEFE